MEADGKATRVTVESSLDQLEDANTRPHSVEDRGSFTATDRGGIKVQDRDPLVNCRDRLRGKGVGLSLVRRPSWELFGQTSHQKPVVKVGQTHLIEHPLGVLTEHWINLRRDRSLPVVTCLGTSITVGADAVAFTAPEKQIAIDGEDALACRPDVVEKNTLKSLGVFPLVTGSRDLEGHRTPFTEGDQIALPRGRVLHR